MRTRGIILLIPLLLFGCSTLASLYAQSSAHDKANGSGESSSSQPGSAESIVAKGENYVVFSYRKTRLQDFLLGSNSKDARADHTTYVLVDGDSMFDEAGRINERALDWDQLGKELRANRKSKSDIATIHMMHHHGTGDRRLLSWLFQGFGLSRGRYSKVYLTNSGPNDFWESIESAQQFASQSDTFEEEPLGNELVQVFPVRTALSRLTSEADCVVRVIPQLVKQPQQELRGAIRASILKYVSKVPVKRKEKLLMLINYHTDASDTVDWLRKEGCMEIAHQSGYEKGYARLAEYSFLLDRK